MIKLQSIEWRPEYKNYHDWQAREVMRLVWTQTVIVLTPKDADQLQEAVDKLYTLTPNIKVTDEMGYMIQMYYAIGVTFLVSSSDAGGPMKTCLYVVPTEASNRVRNRQRNKKAAYQFINFMLRPENV